MSGIPTNSSGNPIEVSGSGSFIIGDRGQIIQNITNNYPQIYQVVQGAARFDPLVRKKTNALIEQHRLFGGRQTELARLDSFVANQASGYFFVTAGTGFGKSALLANWMWSRQVRQQPVCYTFVNRANGLAGEEHTMENLCQQLVAYHELSGQLPASADKLGVLYRDLLEIPPLRAEKLVVVIDGIDEASGWKFGSFQFPTPLPQGVFVVFSARTIAGRNWLGELGLSREIGPDRILELKSLGTREITHLLQSGGQKMAEVAQDQDFVAAIHTASQGDPFYLHYLLEDIVDGQITKANIGQHPVGVHEYLNEWFRQLTDEVETTKEEVNELLGVLSVAKGKLRFEDFRGISSKLSRGLMLNAELSGKLERYLVGNRQEGYAIAHPRFGEFLSDEIFNAEETRDFEQQLLAYCAKWPTHNSYYTLAHYAEHLAEAAQQSEQPQRHEFTAQLVKLVVNPDFREAHKSEVKDLIALQRDVERGLQSAAADTSADEPTRGLPLVFESAYGLLDFRAKELRPEPIFELANAGEIDLALQRLSLFEIDIEWMSATPLIIGWLALRINDDEATRDRVRALRDEVKATGVIYGPSSLLIQQIDAMLEDLPQPTYELPPPPSLKEARERVARLGSSGFTNSLQNSDDSRFLAGEDGLPLVAFAIADRLEGERLFAEYLAIHSSYFYPEYRRGALWVLMEAALRHPSYTWLKNLLPAIAVAALSGANIEFQEGVPLTLGALDAATNDDTARVFFERRRDQVLQAANSLFQEPGKSDFLGLHKRRLLTVAQALAVLLGAKDEAKKLLALAMNVPRGFAGYQTLASLTLAEAVSICQPGDLELANQALYAAHTASHNIVDETFCIRSTARVKAMQEKWWSTVGYSVIQATKRMLENRSSAEFAALHQVGEKFEHRESRPLPQEYFDANTLQTLAEVCKRLPSEFQRLNPQWQTNETLDSDSLVAVPDPGFVTQLAARFAASALVEAGLTDQERVHLIQSLVPIAAASPTALDTVLVRLLLAARPSDTATLDALAEASRMASWNITDPLEEMFTTVRIHSDTSIHMNINSSIDKSDLV